MDKDTRNILRNVVTNCRQLLEDTIAQVLEGQYGVYTTGRVDDVAKMDHLTPDELDVRERIVTHLEHIQSGGFKPADAADQLIREIAFTHLNRLAAYKMMEQRGLIREAVSRGLKSQGFMFYLADHPDDEHLWSTGQQELAYRHFLVWQGEQFANEISVLFSPYDPANFVFPPQRVLDQVLDLINSTELADIWTEDETIGWVYQYFTPKELRDRARKESQAPRNSYELAFRNQFYTPRYVVEFLTDNTLGRTWYEMLQGDTALIEHCQYLVRRPNEIFLAQGEDAPESDIDTSALSQEELLQQPVYIPYRALKDPRRLKVLDPACGSGHFLLYAFDLLAIIYEEAWERDLTDSLGMNLREKYATLDDLRCDIPRLILARNLHGIDIDRRATQIAALALWLRAQRYYNDHSLDRKDRPAITQGNIVLAEPMPGDRALLDEFVAELEPPIDQMVKRVFNEMKLAGEAGSLLKIEEAIQDDITRAREEWERLLQQQKSPQQMALLPDWIEKKPEQLALFDVSKITDAEFFDRAEQLVLEALEAYAQRAENGHGLRRRLFADDAAAGFAFIELMRQQYDVVLMNPPFGAASQNSKEYLGLHYDNWGNEIYVAFGSRSLQITGQTGAVGAITSRLGFFLTSFSEWREQEIVPRTNISAFADLGYGVLDDAMVEVAAWALCKPKYFFLSPFVTLLADKDKQYPLLPRIGSYVEGLPHKEVYSVNQDTFSYFPGAPFCYWVSDAFRKRIRDIPALDQIGVGAYVGISTADDNRYIRLAWEVLPDDIGVESRWVHFVKGGEYTPFYDDVHLLIDWDQGKSPLKETGAAIRNQGFYFKKGVTYSQRSTSAFNPKVLPEGCIFSTGGHGVFAPDTETLLLVFGFLVSRPVQLQVEMSVGSGDEAHSGSAARNYLNGMVSQLRVPDFRELERNEKEQILKLVQRLSRIAYERPKYDETARVFTSLPPIPPNGGLLRLIDAVQWEQEDIELELLQIFTELDDLIAEIYGLSQREQAELDAELGQHLLKFPLGSHNREIEDLVVQNHQSDISAIISATMHRHGAARYITKKSFVSSRRLELLSRLVQINPTRIIQIRREKRLVENALAKDTTLSIVSYTIGAVFGRWDVRYATGERPIPELPDPFDPLPVCPPGMLQNADGLPATETPPSYPIDIDWDGILVDDPDHPDDIVRRMRGVLEVLWGDRAEAIEQEACEILGVKTLRDYFRKPGSGGFWDDHVKRYSKSRRKAPIYWLLQSSRKNYALWLYYHRLDKDLYYKALINYVQPKLRLEQNNLTALRVQLTEAGVAGREAKRLEREVEQQEALMSELQDFHDALERAAQLNLEPDLNDGVVLNIAPLHELVPWKEAEKYWKALLKGEYEWSTISQQLRERGKI